MIILSPSTIFLLLLPGPSFFPRPTFQNETTNQFPYSFQQIKDDNSMETTTNKNLSMKYIVFTNKNILPCCRLMRLYIYAVKLNENKNYLILKPHYDDQQRDHNKSASNGEEIHNKLSLVSNYMLLPTLPLIPLPLRTEFTLLLSLTQPRTFRAEQRLIVLILPLLLNLPYLLICLPLARKNYLIFKPHYDDQQRDHTKSATNGEKIHNKISLVRLYMYAVKLNENKNYLLLKPHYDDQQRDHDCFRPYP